MKDLIQFGGREFTSTKLLDALYNTNRKLTVLEIGANVGYYALLAAKYGHKVYASEPEKNNLDLLESNVDLNGFKNVEVLNYAFGEKEGMGKLYLSDTENYHSMLGTGRSCSVPVTTIDAFTEQRNILPDVIRMDVEGYEYNIFKEADITLDAMRPGSVLFVEIHPDFLSDQQIFEIWDKLVDFNFDCVKEIKEGKEIPVFNYTWWESKFPKLKRTRVCGIEYFFRKGV
jgi:FkbM family methyltransferase